ncbi:glycosyltransferase family A protein [Desulfobacter postgatei]|jgi:hypothetical protein|uniref:glycosyltransferase family A protein n=1 Tax=Desulfobacter postgatei TaxID=2293 RepID=UPI002A3722FC|nr:glycosyltransferase family A protein [Desulfobacter postgatei]MDX9964228.1 glycosyltransferase family A protein [Desulfobacter postgatei]
MHLNTVFWQHQLKMSWSNLNNHSLQSRIVLFVKSACQMILRHFSASIVPFVGRDIEETENLTVILLNHKRPENIGCIAQYILQSGFVGRLVISNNSQDYPIEKYVKIKDPRLVLINQKDPSGVGVRFVLAQQYPSQYYICVDDDIFLHPSQLQWIYWNLRHIKDRPHGIFGAVYEPGDEQEKEWPFVHRRNRTSSIDILNGLFAFSKRHLDEYFKICKLLGIEDPKSLMNGEDIILSFTGDKKPLIHNIGPIWECASASVPGVALHTSRSRFYEERWRIYSILKKSKRLTDT